MLAGLRHSRDMAEQDAARYADIIDLCGDIRQSAESVAALAQQHSRELRKTSRTEREMIGFIVNAIEEKPVKNRPSTNDVEAGGVKARVIRLADGKCELCGSTMFLTCHHIIPRAEGGTNDAENFMALCRSCHDEIEDKGYRTRTEIKRHITAANVFVASADANRRDAIEERKAQRAREEREETAEVFDWAAQWGEGFWSRVPYIKLGDPVPPTPKWCLCVYGGVRRSTRNESTMPLTLRQKGVTEL